MQLRDGWYVRQLGGRWVAARYVSGRRVSRRETGAQDRASAERVVAELNRLERGEAAANAGTVGALWKLYVADRAADGKNTARMGQAWKPLAPVFSELRAEKLTKADFTRYTEHRRALGVSDGGIRTELAYLAAALRFGVDHEHTARAPRVFRPPPGRPRERWLTHEEVHRLIEAAVAPHVKLFIQLAVGTAGRPSHILQLTWDRVDMRRREINLDDPSRDKTAKGRARVPVNDQLLDALSVARGAAQTGHVIEAHERGGFLSIKKGIASAGKRAGLDGVGPYVLRHTAGVWMAQAGVPLERIAEYMGHTSIETTRKHYARFHPGHLRDAANALMIGGARRLLPR